MPYCRMTQLTAVCTYNDGNKTCGNEAEHTQRLIDGKPAPYNSPLILVRDAKGKEHYEARCDEHYLIEKVNH